MGTLLPCQSQKVQNVSTGAFLLSLITDCRTLITNLKIFGRHVYSST